MADGARILTRVCSWGPPAEDRFRIFRKRSWVTVAESASPEEHAPPGEPDRTN
jgi:hypothetical protein